MFSLFRSRSTSGQSGQKGGDSLFVRVRERVQMDGKSRRIFVRSLCVGMREKKNDALVLVSFSLRRFLILRSYFFFFWEEFSKTQFSGAKDVSTSEEAMTKCGECFGIGGLCEMRIKHFLHR